jgi:metallo-beta-lactamase family protein
MRACYTLSMSKKITINFALGARTVTGSNFLIESQNRKILVDCGLLQGEKTAEETNREDFPYNPAEIDALFVTHAHMDHVGRIPKLVRDGFKGPIYSTNATKDLAALMLDDALHLLTHEAEREGIEPLYELADVKHTMAMWHGFEYHQPFSIDKGTEEEIQIVFRDAGHVLGSSMIEFTYNGKKIVFTGDLGNSPAPILRDTERLSGIDYLVMESVYGDRNHESHEERKEKLQKIITDAIERGGTLIIPAFSLERTQDLLFEINDMVEHRQIPRVPIYLDSPLAIKITEVYKKYEHLFNHDTQSIIHKGDDIFKFPGLIMTPETEESKAINYTQGPKIVMAGSGMMNGGRIIHHARNYLGDAKNTILLVGYQALGTPGRFIDEGASQVNLFGVTVPIKAKVEKIFGYSAHKDSDHLVEMIEPIASSLKHIYVVLGEPKSSFFLAQKISDQYGVNISVPERGDIVEIDMGE